MKIPEKSQKILNIWPKTFKKNPKGFLKISNEVSKSSEKILKVSVKIPEGKTWRPPA